MNNELEKSIDKLKEIITEKSESGYEIALYDFGKDGSKTVLQALEEQEKEIVKYQLYLTEDVIPKKKIEDILKKLDSKKVEERVIKFYTPDKKHYYETDKYNDIIRQVLQGLLEDK